MKSKIMKLLAVAFAIVLFASCSQKLVGTWTVQKYETITPEQTNVVLNNIGTMTFKGDGTGEKNLNYTVLGIIQNDNFPFKWNATDNYVTLESENSEFGKTWILLENKRKSQKWKSTDGSNQVQVLELIKVKNNKKN